MMLKHDIVREATRLTRAGQLVEATALLQRMLRGKTVPDATSGTTGRIALTRREPPIIDAEPNTIEETDSPHLARATSAQPRMLRALLDHTRERSGLGQRRVFKRAPLSTSDIVPEGARFIEGSYSNPAGSRAYRLFIPSRYQGQPLPLVVMLHGCTQSPDDFAAGTRMNFIAEEQTCFVVYPAQRSEANQAKCWNWFRTADQQRGRGEPSLNRGHHSPDHARLCGRSKARLRWWTVGRSGRGCYHGRNVPRSVRGNRRTFWPRLWRSH